METVANVVNGMTNKVVTEQDKQAAKDHLNRAKEVAKEAVKTTDAIVNSPEAGVVGAIVGGDA